MKEKERERTLLGLMSRFIKFIKRCPRVVMRVKNAELVIRSLFLIKLLAKTRTQSTLSR